MLIAAIVLSTVALWFLAKGAGAGLVFAFGKGLVLSLAQLAGLLAAALLAANYIFASRARFLERWFGGLDKVYRMHRLLGTAAFMLMLYHPIFLALSVLPNVAAALRYFIPTGNTAYTLGISALALYIALVILSLYPRLPYHMWKRTHIFMGVPLLLLTLHVFLVTSDVSRFLPLALWMGALGALALLAALYRRFFYTRWGPRHDYTVLAVRRLGAITEVTLLPIGESLAFTPGQFVFVSFLNSRVSPEKHPFSVSSGPDAPFLRLSIKSLGDWTAALERLAPGNDAMVYGPYGSFGERAVHENRDQVWIAGGVGITPFLSLAAHRAKVGGAGRIHLFYCTKNGDEAVYLPELDAVSARMPEFEVINHRSAEKGYLTCALVDAKVGGLADKLVLICGPATMAAALIADLPKYRVRPGNIVGEDFSFVS